MVLLSIISFPVLFWEPFRTFQDCDILTGPEIGRLLGSRSAINMLLIGFWYRAWKNNKKRRHRAKATRNVTCSTCVSFPSSFPEHSRSFLDCGFWASRFLPSRFPSRTILNCGLCQTRFLLPFYIPVSLLGPSQTCLDCALFWKACFWVRCLLSTGKTQDPNSL